jgi:hypothetical protein
VLLAMLTSLVSCSARGPRCAYCGMVIDPRSSWNAELVAPDGRKMEFDSPRCALLAWRTGRVAARELRVQDYYDRAWRSGDDVVFVASSDVPGPMGADVVPLDPGRAAQFAREHTGTRPLHLSDVTLDLLLELR